MPTTPLPNGFSRVTRHPIDAILDATGKVVGIQTDTDDQFLASWNATRTALVNPLVGGDVMLGNGVLPGVSGATAFRQAAGQGSTSLGTGRSYANQCPFDKPFYAIQLVFANYNTAAAQVFDAVKVAPSPRSMALENGTGLTWTQVTKDGSNTLTVPIATQGAGGTASNNIIPGYLVSDIIPIASVARTDVVGAPFLTFIRGYSAGDCRISGMGSSGGNGALFFENQGYVYLGQQAVGDIVTTISAITGAASGGSVATGVIFYTSDTSYELPLFGDSLLAGYSGNADARQAGWPVQISPLLKAKSKLAGVANYGVGGQLHLNSILTMKAFVTAYKPKAVLFYNFSPNTGTSQALLDSQLALTLDTVRWCRLQGVTPIVAIASPCNNALLLTHNAKTVAALGNSCKILDFYTVTRDPANPTQILPAYNYDNVHLNDAGNAALAQYVSDQLAI